ncbi:BTB/POZ and MATH domain-containing protein 3 [Balamuthia mandrillaris]
MERRQAAALQNVIKSHKLSFTATPTAKFKLLLLKRSAYSRAALSYAATPCSPPTCHHAGLGGNGESDGGRHSRTKSKVEAWVRSFFLPAGYPASVGSTYWQFQKWEVLKSAIGSATYVISTKALLTAVGLGAAGSSTGAAAIAWVLKDGLGCMGTMLVAGAFGKYFDSETKRIRWAADLLHVTGVGLELITPLCPVYFLPLASLANAAKGIAAHDAVADWWRLPIGLTNGATRASIYKSFALEENLGDITAKGQSQGIAAYLAGMGLGIGITLLVGTSIDAAGLFFTFGSLSCLQLYFSYKALTGVKLSTLNTQRTYFLIKHFLHSRQVEQSNQNEDYCASNTIRGDVLTPAEVQEYIILPAPYGRMAQHIVLGSSVADALAALSRAPSKQYGGKEITEMQPNIIASCLLQRLVKEAFAKEKYLLAWNCNNSGPVHVLLHKDATSEDILKAFFNAYLLKFFSSDSLEQFHEGINDHSAATCRQPNQDQSFEAIHQSLHKTQQLFPKFLHGLKQNGWNMHVFLGTRPNRAIWGDALSLPQ